MANENKKLLVLREPSPLAAMEPTEEFVPMEPKRTIESAMSQVHQSEEPDLEYWKTLAEDKTMELTDLKATLGELLSRTEAQVFLDQLERGIGTASSAAVWLKVYDFVHGTDKYPKAMEALKALKDAGK